jgi:hypothetical protein
MLLMTKIKLARMGHLLKWARATKGKDFGTAELADALRRFDPGITDQIVRNMESNRTAITVDLLDWVGTALDLPANWHMRVPNPATLPDSTRSLQTPADFEVIAAPVERKIPLRASYMADRAVWRRRILVPGHFFRTEYLSDPDEYPVLLADVVQEGELDLHPNFFVPGDELLIRTNLNPQPPVLVVATDRRGRPLRRQLVQARGELLLRHPAMAQPDVPALDVAAIEGVIVARLRRLRGNGMAAVHVPEGLHIEDF